MKTYRFIVTYTNDKRETEVKAMNEKEAIETLENRAKRAMLKIVKIELTRILN
jgi:hypothetical protein